LLKTSLTSEVTIGFVVYHAAAIWRARRQTTKGDGLSHRLSQTENGMPVDSCWKFFRRRLRYWLNHSERNRLLWDEMEFHIESRTQELAAQGMSEPDARAAAHREFGNMTQKSEEARSTWIARWMGDLTQDLRHSVRGMRRDAGFTAFAILIAGLGIGASSTVFSVVNALLLRPLPFGDPGGLVWIANGNDYATQTEHYSDLRELNRSFSDLAGWSGFYRPGDEELTGIGEPERLTSVPVTGNFFALLGVQPAIGRSFTTEECQGRYSAPPALLLSHNFWRWRFAADPNVVGRKLTLNNRPATVVGVLPASFDFGSVFAPGAPIDIFVPWPLNDKTKPRGNTMKVIGRLKPGATVPGAQAELTILGKQLESQHPERNSIAPRLVPLEQHVSGPVSPALFVLACAVGVVIVDCMRECFESTIGEVRRAAKGNGDAGGVRSGPFATPAADAYGERGALVLRRRVGIGPRSGRYTRTGSSPCIQPSFARKRSYRWERAPFHLAGGGGFRRTVWPAAGATGHDALSS
jgi:hypothetical protein